MRRDLTKFWLFDKVLVVHQIVKGKKGLNVKFEVDEKKEKQKERAPPNSVARIRSNLNLEVLFEVKKAKNAKSPKISQSFFCIFFAKTTGQNDTKICTVNHINIIYKCSFIKQSLFRKKSKLKIVPNNKNNNNNNNNFDSSMVWTSPQTKREAIPIQYIFACISSFVCMHQLPFLWTVQERPIPIKCTLRTAVHSRPYKKRSCFLTPFQSIILLYVLYSMYPATTPFLSSL